MDEHVRLDTLMEIPAPQATFHHFVCYSRSKGNKLREQSTLFLCYSREICVEWATKIKAAILGMVPVRAAIV